MLYEDIRTNGGTGSSIGVAGKKIRAVVILVSVNEDYSNVLWDC